MGKINFMMGIHNHQPVGNFDHVFEDAYQKSYLPFLQVLKRFPGVRISIHFTGPLYEWLEEKHPEIFDILIPMVAAKQIELIGGGFYEPILCVLPEEDAVGQIDMMSKYINKKFKTTPTGFWLAERVWEPSLPSFAKTNNMKYTILDESHFAYAGLTKEKIHGYYITEDKGVTMSVFPISFDLRYTIPFKPVKDTEILFRKLSEEGNVAGISFADDGEKFGTWPGTYDWVYKQGWLEKFFGFLQDNHDWISMPFFSEYIKEYPAEGRVYIPTASYMEMSEWSLLSDAGIKYEEMINYLKKENKFSEYEPFARGGFWRNFQAKYEESNNMHKKMLQVSQKVHAIKEAKVRKEALEFLWKGQCNCPYWHGVFGGLYLNPLRFATYRNLLIAERMADKAAHAKKTWKEVEIFDFDKDGKDEIIVNTEKLNIYIAPSNGGSIFEFDYKPRDFNYLDVLTRKQEAYHHKIKHAQSGHQNDGHASIHDIVNLKESGMEKYLVYDNYRRSSLIDHFICPNVSLDQFVFGKYKELGDFYKGEYHVMHDSDKKDVTLEREGTVKKDKAFLPVNVKKKISIEKESSIVSFNYTVTNKAEVALNFVFGVEFVFTLLAGNAPDRHYYIPGHEDIDNKMGSTGEVCDVSEVQAIDDWMKSKIVFNFNNVCRLWRFPIETISQSEGGMERTYQGSVIFPNWHLHLKPGEKWTVKIKKEIFSWD